MQPSVWDAMQPVVGRMDRRWNQIRLPGLRRWPLFYRKRRRKSIGLKAIGNLPLQVSFAKGFVRCRPDRILRVCRRVWLDSLNGIFDDNLGIRASLSWPFVGRHACDNSLLRAAEPLAHSRLAPDAIGISSGDTSQITNRYMSKKLKGL